MTEVVNGVRVPSHGVTKKNGRECDDVAISVVRCLNSQVVEKQHFVTILCSKDDLAIRICRSKLQIKMDRCR